MPPQQQHQPGQNVPLFLKYSLSNVGFQFPRIPIQIQRACLIGRTRHVNGLQISRGIALSESGGIAKQLDNESQPNYAAQIEVPAQIWIRIQLTLTNDIQIWLGHACNNNWDKHPLPRFHFIES